MLYCIARVILYDNQKKDCQDCGKIYGVLPRLWQNNENIWSVHMDEVLLDFTRGGHLYLFRAIAH